MHRMHTDTAQRGNYRSNAQPTSMADRLNQLNNSGQHRHIAGEQEDLLVALLLKTQQAIDAGAETLAF